MQDEPLPLWLPQLAVQGGPRFLQIADALQAAVADGSLKPGDRLPPQRRLAAQLDVDLTTVTRAYDEARRRQLLEGRGARGTYVAAPKVELNAVLDLRDRKSTRLNSSHQIISYAVFCLKKKNKMQLRSNTLTITYA